MQENIIGKAICPDCNGNGYQGDSKFPEQCKDCGTCNNQGELTITDKDINQLLVSERKQ